MGLLGWLFGGQPRDQLEQAANAVKIGLLLPVCSILLLLTIPRSLLADELDTYRDKYTNAVAKITSDHKNQVSRILDAYSSGLNAIRATTQNAGELDALKLVLAEIDRFEQTKALPPQGTAQDRPLRSLCDKSRQDLTAADETRKTAIVTLTGQYANALDQLQRELTRKGDIEKATNVQLERKRLSAPDVTAPLAANAMPQADRQSGVSALVPPDVSQWRSVIWNKQAARWQKQSLQTLTTKTSERSLWVKNTSTVHRAAKVSPKDSLNGDFTVVMEIRGQFGVELMHTSGESAHGFGVYGFPADEWLRLVISRKGDSLSIQSSDGKERAFKGDPSNVRAPLDLCISLSSASEAEIRHFQQGQGQTLLLAEQRPKSPVSDILPKEVPIHKAPATEVQPLTPSTAMADELKVSLDSFRNHFQTASKNEEGWVALTTLVDSIRDEIKTQRPHLGSARTVPVGIDKYDSEMQALIESAESEIAKWKQLGDFLTTRGYKFSSPGKYPYQEFDKVADARLSEIRHDLAQEHDKQTSGRKACLADLVATIDKRLTDNKNGAEITARVEALYKKYQGDRGTSERLDKVVFDTDKYKGKVIRSTAHIHDPEGFFAPLLATEPQPFFCTDALREKCFKAYDAKGEYGVVNIKYVVGDDGKFYLLDIWL